MTNHKPDAPPRGNQEVPARGLTGVRGEPHGNPRHPQTQRTDTSAAPQGRIRFASAQITFGRGFVTAD